MPKSFRNITGFGSYTGSIKKEAGKKTAQEEGRKELEEKYGEVWNTEELQRDFIVDSFLAPNVIVTRKSDNQKGTLEFQHMPRLYFDFEPYTKASKKSYNQLKKKISSVWELQVKKETGDETAGYQITDDNGNFNVMLNMKTFDTAGSLEEAKNKVNESMKKMFFKPTNEWKQVEDSIKKEHEKMSYSQIKKSIMEKFAPKQPPKVWWDKMYKKIKKGNPKYDDEKIRETVGNIWYNELSDSKRKEILQREKGKKKTKKSIMKTGLWKDKLQNVYDSFEEFKKYDDTYGLTGRLGYDSPENAWEDNPLIQGSTDPADFKVVKEETTKISYNQLKKTAQEGIKVGDMVEVQNEDGNVVWPLDEVVEVGEALGVDGDMHTTVRFKGEDFPYSEEHYIFVKASKKTAEMSTDEVKEFEEKTIKSLEDKISKMKSTLQKGNIITVQKQLISLSDIAKDAADKIKEEGSIGVEA